ncbi:hypothetical protein BGZ52_003227 [Haplosporangium bisporale]|nr:hypothetical protein BGZ52_003227 [Haplosporangium bisporale]
MLRASLALPRHGVRAATLTRLTPFSTSATKLRQQQSLAPVLNFSDEVKAALANNKPIVALESTIISHGMPYPQNYETAIQVESVVRENGATPATIAILDGQIQIGLSNSQIQNLAELGRESVKASRRDLAVVMSKKQTGATTVSATMLLAHRAGISVFATGGIGGVHRGYEETLDASADLTELGRTPVAVVCAGVKSILDIGRTLEFLETEGVTVATYGQTTDFPAFFTRKSGFQSLLKVETPLEAAKLIAANHAIDLQSGIVFAVPIAKEHAMDDKVVSDAIDTAIRESVENNVLGKESTPFLLKRVNELTGGNSLKSNIALVKQNAAIAAKIAKDLSKLSGSQARTYSTSARVFNRHTEHDTSSSAHGPIMVIGGTVVDITSTADPARLVSGQENDVTMNSMIHSSHPGATRISLGGVGRNVAEVISRLDNQNCVFVSAVGGQHVPGQGSSATDDLFGPWLVSEVARRGMIKEAIAKHKPRTICFDANISVECMKATLEACRGQDIHTFFEPTSVAKCGRVLDSTMAASLTDGLLRFATPNEYELQEMATHARKLMSNNPDDVLIKGLGDRAIVRGHHDMDSVTTKESESQDLQKEYTSLLLDAFSVSHFIPTLFIKLGAKGVLVFQRSQLNAYQESRQCKDFKVERLDLEQSKVISDEKGGQDMSPFTVTWRSFPANKVSGIKSVTGAGDSLVGSVVTSLHHLGDLRVLLSENKLVQGRDRKNGHSTTGVDPFAFWKQMDRVISDAQAAAALTMQTHETVSPSLSTSPQATLLASKPKVISS